MAAALPGTSVRDVDYIRWELPLAQGRALIHPKRILEGEVMIWPDARLSKRGRWWEKVKELWRGKSG